MFSDPVVGEKFFGRNKTLKLLAKRVNGLRDGYRQNIAIIGPRLIGKSSLILHFLSDVNYHNVLPIYIDLRPKAFSHFIYKFLGTLLYRYLKNKNIAVNEDLESLKKVAQAYIPKTIDVIQRIEQHIKSSQFDRAYESLLTLTSLIKQESNICCIVIFDEFHLLDTYKLKDPFSTLAKEIMVQRDTMYILISSQVSLARKTLANQLFLLFGNFEIIQLKPFNYITCCKFLERRFHSISLPKNLKDFLIAFSEGHPFYLDILSNKLTEKAKELNKTEISSSLLSLAFNSLIYDSQGILNQYFTNLLTHNLNGADYSNFLPILVSASEKASRLGDISQLTNRPAKIISRQINYLLDKDLLSKIGVFYRIQDRIFRFWIKSVYQRKQLSLVTDPETESKDFSKEIEEEVALFSRESKKDLAEKLIDLFRSFRNEIIIMQNKAFKFWHFDEIHLLRRVDLKDCLIACYKEGCWACLIKEDRVGETQLQEFYYFCRTAKYKIRKAIIISLQKLDLNVRLAALEKRMWIWTLSDLNLLLDLYGKQKIVG